MRLSFDSIEEVKTFVAGLKGTRGKKGEDDEAGAGQTGQIGGTAPTPLAPPVGGAQAGFPGTTQFAPPVGGAAPLQGFPAAGAPQIAPEAIALAMRIGNRTDAVIATPGQDGNGAVNWLRSQCGAEAANATLAQIKESFLPKLSVAQLTTIAGLIGA